MRVHAHPSRLYRCRRRPSASSKPSSFPHIIWFALFSLVLRRQPRARNDTRVPAEFSDDSVAYGDANVVDSGTAAASDLPRSRNETVAELAGLDGGDLALRCHDKLIARIERTGEG